MHCYWHKQNVLLQMVGCYMYIHCYYSFTNVSFHETHTQNSHSQFNSHPVNNLITYIYEVWPFLFPHKYCIDRVILETQDWKCSAKCYPLSIHHLVTISLLKAVSILDRLEMLKTLSLVLSVLPPLYFRVSQRLRRCLNMWKGAIPGQA